MVNKTSYRDIRIFSKPKWIRCMFWKTKKFIGHPLNGYFYYSFRSLFFISALLLYSAFFSIGREIIPIRVIEHYIVWLRKFQLQFHILRGNFTNTSRGSDIIFHWANSQKYIPLKSAFNKTAQASKSIGQGHCINWIAEKR